MITRNSLFILGGILILFFISLSLVLRRQTPPGWPDGLPGGGLATPQENSAGEVDITVTPLTLIVGRTPSFEIEFNTHSVELNFDLTKVSSLADDSGKTYSNPTWEGSPPGGHHRSGKLIFADSLKQTKSVILTLRGIAGSDRIFNWQI